MDPEAGFVPFDGQDGTPYQPVTWIDRGILRELSYDRRYAIRTLQKDQTLLNSKSFTLMAAPGVPTVTIDEMIAKTERGVLVTRLSGVQSVGGVSLLITGYTRDGTWLIEHGKIAKAIKNFRITESPLFALNNVEDVGTPVRVFQPGHAVMTPPLRVRDFSFTSLADAV
jgi:predicted Zn-dependent protease